MHVIILEQNLKKNENNRLEDPNRQQPYAKILYRSIGALLLLLHQTYSYNNLHFYGTFCHIKVTSVKVICPQRYALRK